MWYEIRVKGIEYEVVYTEEEIISESCTLVNACGIDPDDIEIITHN